jgi:transcription termination/antitermination protein NusG
MVVSLVQSDLPAPAYAPQGTEASEPSPIDQFVGRWWLVHTKSRQEKALAADLAQLHIGVFLPLVRAQRHYGRRAVEVRIPLFPAYLFICGDETDRYATLTTHRAAQVLAVADQEQLKRELRQIHRVTTSTHEIDLYPGLRRGRRCRITGGSLQGIEGVVIRRQGRCHVSLGVEVLSQSAELVIDPSLLEIID